MLHRKSNAIFLPLRRRWSPPDAKDRQHTYSHADRGPQAVMDHVVHLKESPAGRQLQDFNDDRKACSDKDPLPSKKLSGKNAERYKCNDIGYDLFIKLPVMIRPERNRLQHNAFIRDPVQEGRGENKKSISDQ